jgi:hypothetical protein
MSRNQINNKSGQGLEPSPLIEIEVKRGNAIVAVADQVLRHATLQVQAAKILSDHGLDPTSHLPKIDVKTLQLTAVKALNGTKQQ